MDAFSVGACVTMACPPIEPGANFLPTVLSHIDCQARSLGAYGYGALSDPGSSISIALTSLLILFVGFFGIRLMLGYESGRGDLVGSVLKIGIVLTLASSWPAFRTVIYDVVIEGPGELARTAGTSADVSDASAGAWTRLQAIDQSLIAVTSLGTGRLPGGDLRDEFKGYPLPDESGFGWGRVAFLLGIIAPFAIVRLGAGLLLALTPLMAPWLLFERSSGLFFGWLRALAFVVLGSVSVALLSGFEISILEPWARSSASLRLGGAFLPSAPTELLVIALVFLAAQIGILTMLGRLTFFNNFASRRGIAFWNGGRAGESIQDNHFTVLVADGAPRSRAHSIADSVALTMRREQLSRADRHPPPVLIAPLPGAAHGSDTAAGTGLGSSYRRGHQRTSATAIKRDRTT
jgi:type IV secretion system protein VirB6